MPKYVAFLRGINLGKRRVKMDGLRQHFVDFGLEGAETFISSGNVVFDYSGSGIRSLEESIEQHLRAALGFEVETFVRPLALLALLPELDAVTSAVDAGLTPHVIFLRRNPSRKVEANLKTLETSDDRFHVTGREVFWFRRGGLSDSPIAARDLEKALEGIGNSTRNLNTVRRIVAKFHDEV